TSRKMFGGICYLYQDRMFAFITGESLVTKLPAEEREQAFKSYGATEFLISEGRPFGEWTQFPLAEPGQVDTVIPWVEKGLAYVKSIPSSRRSTGRRPKSKASGDTTR
ncbi:MAG: TfoX/Sxy family protein, partial [Dehalococcoidia bacterium]